MSNTPNKRSKTVKKAKAAPRQKKPTGLDETKQREILAIISVGCNRTTAARYAGCGVADIRREAERNPQFGIELLRAEEQSEIFFLEKIRKAAHKEQYWRAAAWALERRFPSRYASRGAQSLSMDEVHQLVDGLAAMVADEMSSDNDRRRLLKRIRLLVHEIAGNRKGDEPMEEIAGDDNESES